MFPYQSFNTKYMNNTMNFNNNTDNNKMSLLSLLNSSILVQNHAHPLIYCYTLDRAKFGKSWRCNKCGSNYLHDKPSFYCVFCDFDVCELCIFQLKLCDIILYDYNYNLFNQTPNNQNQIFNWQMSFNFHNHLLTLIKKTNYNYKWGCNGCNQIYNNSESFYYCNLCNFHLCPYCMNKWKNNNNNQSQENFLYLSNGQLKNQK